MVKNIDCNLTGPELAVRELPTSASRALGLKVHTSSKINLFLFFKIYSFIMYIALCMPVGRRSL